MVIISAYEVYGTEYLRVSQLLFYLASSLSPSLFIHLQAV